MTPLFFELIQMTVGNREALSCIPTEQEWMQLFNLAKKQAMAGVLFPAVEKVQKEKKTTSGLPKWMLQWFSMQLHCERSNALLNQRAKELTEIFCKGGRRSCVLKGPAVARLYLKPELRQCGDIDIWVEGKRDEILTWIESRWAMGSPVYHHVDCNIFSDVPVEVHFIPVWMHNPIRNRQLQKFFRKEETIQFQNMTGEGFCVPTMKFNLIYSLVHIYHHLFDEGIGLRQLMDYYYIVINATEEDRKEALKVLHHVGMYPFATAVEYVLEIVFGLSLEFALCPRDVGRGKFLLAEIMATGNFGQYDTRINKEANEGLLKRTIRKWRRQMRFISSYPQEVLCIPIWKAWHYSWRRYKGYI